jgi:hypothetical protein
MKKGIIILFSEDEKLIDKHQLARIFNQKEVMLCYVNNGSKDATFEVLESVKEELEIKTACIIDIKKKIPTRAAVKAASRYLKSLGGINCILYFKSNKLSFFEDKKVQIETIKKINNHLKCNLHHSKNNLKYTFSYKDILSF